MIYKLLSLLESGMGVWRSEIVAGIFAHWPTLEH